VIDFLSYTEVRYREGSRSITFSAEIIEDKGHPKRWGLAVYIPQQLRWDNGDQSEAIAASKKRLILSRLGTALKAKVDFYRISEFTSGPGIRADATDFHG
jgi:hypothetical protein